MRLSKVLSIQKVKMKTRMITLGILITGILSIVFIVVTFYGQHTGNFTLALDYDSLERGIVLSETSDFSKKKSILTAAPSDYAQDITYSWLKLDEVENTDGSYKDPDYEYVAYTFYIKNEGFETVDISYHMRISDVHNNLDKAIRIMIIEDGIRTMYQKADELDEFGNPPTYPQEIPTSTSFLSELSIMRGRFTNFKPGNIKKFSIIMWIEGYDPDANDSILGGMLKAYLNFTISREVIE